MDRGEAYGAVTAISNVWAVGLGKKCYGHSGKWGMVDGEGIAKENDQFHLRNVACKCKRSGKIRVMLMT